jgi:hypothetical protein
MYKESQKRSVFDKARDLNPFSSSLEMFSTELKTLMTSIRKNDSSIRKKFTSEDSPEKLLKTCNSMFKRKEYMQCVLLLDKIREKFIDVNKLQSELILNVNENYKNFFISKLKGKEREELVKLKELLDKRTATASLEQFQGTLKKIAFTDWFKSVFTQRGRALKAWERAHGEDVAGLKEGILEMMELARQSLDEFYAALKETSLFIAQRNVSGYLRQIRGFKRLSDNYDKAFVKFYNTKVKHILEGLTKEDNSIVPELSEGSATPDDDQTKKPELPSLPNKTPSYKNTFDPYSNNVKAFYLNKYIVKQSRINLLKKAKQI